MFRRWGTSTLYTSRFVGISQLLCHRGVSKHSGPKHRKHLKSNRDLKTAPIRLSFEREKKKPPLPQSALDALRNVELNKKPPPKQLFDYFLILDFEATCCAPNGEEKIEVQEIIEFPVLKLSSSTWETEATFHHYVKPQIHPELTGFCTRLTGIIQPVVDKQPGIKDVLQMFHAWMHKQGLFEEGIKFAFVTYGDADLGKMLPTQCARMGISVPHYFREWINIKRPVSDVTAIFPRAFHHALDVMDVEHVGRHHHGLDDVKNMANLMAAVANRGHVFQLTKQAVR